MKVKFVPQDVEFEIEPGQSVMTLAHEKGIVIHSTCNGMPSCAECRVRVTEGDYNTSPPSRKELSLIGTGYFIDQRRLSCQMLCFGDITVDTSEQIERGAEGPVTKKFLTKVKKTNAADSHSLGGVLIEQDEELLKTLTRDVPDQPQANTAASLKERGGSGSNNNRRNRGGGGQPSEAKGSGGGGQGQGNRGGRRRRRGGGGGGGQGGGGRSSSQNRSKN